MSSIPSQGDSAYGPSGAASEAVIVPPLTPHPNVYHKISPWLDEQMWGHRLWDAETPWLVFLEFLTVADALYRDGKLLQGDAPYPLTFKPRQRMYLRNLLFKSEDVMLIAQREPDSRAAWQAWLSSMSERARAIPERDFSYLQSRFHSFEEFGRVVRLLRDSVVERDRNRRWSSRFVFPFGSDALYEDLNVSETTQSASREYINFGRTGELLYMMMCRSIHRNALRPLVTNMVGTSNRWNKLVQLLQPANKGDEATRGQSFLPYASHPVFDALAEDWLAVGRLQLPGFDAYPHYVTLAGMHLLRYHAAVSAGWVALRDETIGTGPINFRPGAGAPLRMVCEILAPKKTLVRELALIGYSKNDSMSTGAIEQFILGIQRSATWQHASQEPGAFARCRQVLQDVIWWGDDYEGPNDPDALLAALRASALKRHREHVGQFHRATGREIGLVSRRGTTRFRYAPTDQLIKTLLLANVERRMEFGEFLARLFERYGLIIGDREAEGVLAPDEFDKKAFQANARRLEQRLGTLGLLRRLSDACAYVINPYSGPALLGAAPGRNPSSSSTHVASAL
jgi:hypothetical protein